MNAAFISLLVFALIFGGIPGFGAPASPQNPASSIGALNLVVIEGQGEVNNIKQRTARELIVEVDDENHKPVSEALLTFLLPAAGAGGVFAGGLLAAKVTTDKNGRATVKVEPNHVSGTFKISVTATFAGLVATAVITETNAVVAGTAAAGAAATGAAVGIHSAATVTILGAVAVAGSVVAAVLPTALTQNAPAASPR